MKEFYCGAVVPDCDARFRAETSDQILRDVAIHAREHHGLAESPPDMIDRIAENIRDLD